MQPIATRFVSSITADWTSVPETGEYVDPQACFKAPTGISDGHNPTSPCGFPSFAKKPDGTPTFSFQMNPIEALVLVFRTPTTMHRLSFAQGGDLVVVTTDVVGHLEQALGQPQPEAARRRIQRHQPGQGTAMPGDHRLLLATRSQRLNEAGQRGLCVEQVDGGRVRVLANSGQNLRLPSRDTGIAC